MISAVLYGRNDSYGYNLHKRAAISLNCIAEVLTYPGDEIIFVDCNTPDDIPTFPEAIFDTLTPKVKDLLRILRLRPQLYEKYKKGSPLKALEPLSRNIAIRRSNRSNRWILSTNTDMVFVIRDPKKSLSDVVAELPRGFYELPRFEVPEGLWESVNRTDPVSIISAFRTWGQRLHLNEAIISRPDIRFDGPGDFQLMLREQIFEIYGFNEEMVLGWHVDSNLCKRLYLLNGKTESLLDHVFAYHCDHTRQSTFMHSTDRTENSINRFVDNVTSPYLPDQSATWGIPHEEIEEIHLAEGYQKNYVAILETLLPGMADGLSVDVFMSESSESYDHGQIYNTLHAFPFLADHLNNLASSANIGYFGANIVLLDLMGKFLDTRRYKGHLMVSQELFRVAYPQGGLLPPQCVSLEEENIMKQSDLFIFDVAMMHLPQVIKRGNIAFPEDSDDYKEFVKSIKVSFLRCIQLERVRFIAREQLRKFLLVGSQHTWFESFASNFVGVTLTPYSSHIRHGYLLADSDLSNILKEKEEDHTEPLLLDEFWMDAVNFVKSHMKHNEKLLGPMEFMRFLPGETVAYFEPVPKNIEFQWAVINKGMLGEISLRVLECVMETMKAVFANEVFVIFSTHPGLPEISRRSPHYSAFLKGVYAKSL